MDWDWSFNPSFQLVWQVPAHQSVGLVVARVVAGSSIELDGLGLILQSILSSGMAVAGSSIDWNGGCKGGGQFIN